MFMSKLRGKLKEVLETGKSLHKGPVGLLFGTRLFWASESGRNLKLPLRPRASMNCYQSTGDQRACFNV
jgi:hypothetical protein